MRKHKKICTFNAVNCSGCIMKRIFSMTSQFDMVFPGTVCGIDADILILACGLRYKLCGKYNGTASLTLLIACIFIVCVCVFCLKKKYLGQVGKGYVYCIGSEKCIVKRHSNFFFIKIRKYIKLNNTTRTLRIHIFLREKYDLRIKEIICIL